jgi:hypothetical protein
MQQFPTTGSAFDYYFNESQDFTDKKEYKTLKKKLLDVLCRSAKQLPVTIRAIKEELKKAEIPFNDNYLMHALERLEAAGEIHQQNISCQYTHYRFGPDPERRNVELFESSIYNGRRLAERVKR